MIRLNGAGGVIINATDMSMKINHKNRQNREILEIFWEFENPAYISTLDMNAVLGLGVFYKNVQKIVQQISWKRTFGKVILSAPVFSWPR